MNARFGEFATVATLVVRESLRRKLFLVLAIVSVLELGLYAMGLEFIRHQVDPTKGSGIALQAGQNPLDVVAASFFGINAFAIDFLAGVLGVFLTIATVQADAERGLLQPLVVRPVGRSTLLVGRWFGAAIVAAVHVVLMYLATVGLTDWITGWHPEHLVRPALEVGSSVIILTALSTAGSVVLGFVPNGIAVLTTLGIGQVGGLLAGIGRVFGNDDLRTTGRVIGRVVPFEAMYQLALADITKGSSGVAGYVLQLGPLGSAESGGPLLVVWAVVWTAGVLALGTWAFARRDL